MKREERAWARGVFKAFHPFAVAGAFEGWLEYVEAIEVELHPNSRATLIHPETRLPVELRWDPDTLLVTSFLVTAGEGDSHLPWAEVSMSWYVAALGLALSKTIDPGIGGPPPAKGQPPSLNFYRQLDAEYQQLLREGHPTPIAELARRHDAKRDTVKSWLLRGRRYLQAQDKDTKGKNR